MITASHNGAVDNGFKVFGPGGAKLSASQSTTFEAWLADEPTTGVPGPVDDVSTSARDAYLAALTAVLPPLSSLEGRLVVIDLANGAATAVRHRLEQILPCDVAWVGAGDGVINDRVGSEHTDALAGEVRRRGAAAGLALDGDADRCVLVDERGNQVHGDAVPWLLTRHGGHSAIAVTVMSTGALEASLDDVRIVRTPVGDKHLLAALRKDTELALGSEESGHVVFRDGLPAGDGLLTGVRCLVAAFSMSSSLADAVAPFVPFPLMKAKVAVDARPPLEHVAAIVEAKAAAEAALGKGGRVFLRYSGTEPVVRILVEGRDATEVAHVIGTVRTAVRTALS
jgi:phosphoglucosamine mutase